MNDITPLQNRTTQRDLLQLQTNVPSSVNNSTSSNIIERKQIPNTPFTIIKHQDIGYFTTIANYRLTEPTKTIEEQLQLIENKDWILITSLCRAIFGIESKLQQDAKKIPTPKKSTKKTKNNKL